MSNVIVVAVDGCIGAGKTTCIQLLMESMSKWDLEESGLRIHAHCVFEPIVEMPEELRHIVFQEYYRAIQGSPSDTAASHMPAVFQLWWAHMKHKMLRKKIESLTASPSHVHFVFLERSHFGDSAFIRLLRSRDRLTDWEEALIQSVLCTQDERMPDVFLHLTVPVDEALARISSRGRSGEDRIDRVYLEQLQSWERRELQSAAKAGIRLFEFDTTRPLSELVHDLQKTLEKFITERKNGTRDNTE